MFSGRTSATLRNKDIIEKQEKCWGTVKLALAMAWRLFWQEFTGCLIAAEMDAFCLNHSNISVTGYSLNRNRNIMANEIFFYSFSSTQNWREIALPDCSNCLTLVCHYSVTSANGAKPKKDLSQCCPMLQTSTCGLAKTERRCKERYLQELNLEAFLAFKDRSSEELLLISIKAEHS